MNDLVDYSFFFLRSLRVFFFEPPIAPSTSSKDRLIGLWSFDLRPRGSFFFILLITPFYGSQGWKSCFCTLMTHLNLKTVWEYNTRKNKQEPNG